MKQIEWILEEQYYDHFRFEVHYKDGTSRAFNTQRYIDLPRNVRGFIHSAGKYVKIRDFQTVYA